MPRSFCCSRMALWLAASLIVVLTGACGGGGGGGSGDGGSGEVSDEAYFGLTTGTCYLFRGGLGGVQEMTIGVEEENDALGFVAKKVRYRLGGFLRRTDYVTVENGQALIHRRTEVGNPGLDVDFDPPIAWLQRPYRVTGTSPLRTDTTATDVYSGETETWIARTSQLAAEALTVEGLSAPTDAFPTYVTYDRTLTDGTALSEQDVFYLAPEVGLLKADLDGDDLPDVELVEIRQLAEGETTCTTGG